MFRNLLILFTLTVLSACSKFEPAEFGLGIPIVYAVLDHNDTVHYVRINKTFNGNVPTNEMANNPDSILYTIPLDVKIFVFDRDKTIVDILTFTKKKIVKDSVNKDGNVIFDVKNHYVFVYYGQLPVGREYSYYLEIRDKDEILIASAYSNLLSNFIFGVPKENESILLEKGFKITTAWTVGNASIVKSDITIIYYEHNKREKRYYEREVKFFSPMMNANAGGFGYDCNSIIDFIFQQIEKYDSPDIDKRYIGRMKVNYYAANKDLADYILNDDNINSIASGMTTLSPISNISGGFGIFASRAVGIIEPVFFTPSTREYFKSLNIYKFPSTIYYTLLPDSLTWRADVE